jgi:hypothetical protein
VSLVINLSILSADSLALSKDGLDYENWRFELPCRGRTVLVRNQKSGKILRSSPGTAKNFGKRNNKLEGRTLSHPINLGARQRAPLQINSGNALT